MKVGFISLGCSKNLIDTEVVIGKFKNHNYEIVQEPEKAEIIVINTCGFIESAKEEAINTILEMAEYKAGMCKYLIVMGCLVQRYYKDLQKAIPEVDLWIKLEDYDNFWKMVDELVNNNKVIITKQKLSSKITEMEPLPMLTYEEFLNRVVTTGKNYAYLKIGEGCSNRCTYCAIPYIRGPFVSRKMEDIVDEAKELANKGYKEIIVIAQDTTKYGEDIYGKSCLAELLDNLSKIDGIEWIRFLYSYPEGITDELIDVVANNDKIAKYFDIPIQHISDKLLKMMNRKTSKKQITGLIEKIRSKIPDATLRTSLIVGFPSETEEDFKELQDFVKDAKFDKLGAFPYSKEEGTPAAKLPNQIHGNTKKARYNRIMMEQQEISKQNLLKRIGNVEKVLVEDMSFDGKYFVGRTIKDVPDIDGLVYIKNTMSSEVSMKNILNSFVDCKIVDISEYDLIAELID